jgi:hypothetical protein
MNRLLRWRCVRGSWLLEALSMSEKPSFIIIRYYFLGVWQIGWPVVLRFGAIPLDMIGGFAKHHLPWILRPLFSAVVLTSRKLPPELAKLMPNARGLRPVPSRKKKGRQ